MQSLYRKIARLRGIRTTFIDRRGRQFSQLMQDDKRQCEKLHCTTRHPTDKEH
ncbi:hypothetical protein CPter91_0707 [Collimonas pratensis]|uniref:Uncharacterized protein n=1 Tax=Collimonas pratensis TaxID=279113 RepID=A0A127Q0E6_9BURK|nr:hypothetical protein CPter91_0707 [Collimonas pratensis]